MPTELSPSALRVQAALRDAGVDFEVVELPASTRTAQDAAQAIGCQLGQIAKSLLFKTASSARGVLVIASGAHQVDLAKVEALVGEPVALGDPDFVRQVTGFAIGGVPPLGHPQPLTVYLDESLKDHEVLWAAAGTSHAVFALRADDLPWLTGGVFASVAQGS
jgi:prolyl-tRNA editing enzyme YbaK/EbsC (Cys-tRNA(Pro) deacylase)